VPDAPAYDIINICNEIKKMPAQGITSIARSAMRDDEYNIINWTAKPMVTDSIGIGTIGFVRVLGTASTSTDRADWSVVVKVLEMDGDLRAVPCHGITQVREATLLWLATFRIRCRIPGEPKSSWLHCVTPAISTAVGLRVVLQKPNGWTDNLSLIDQQI